MDEPSKWDDKYRRGEYPGSEPAAVLAQAIAGRMPGRALDIACGAGRNAICLAFHNWKVTGVDASAVGLELAQKVAAQERVSIDWRLANLERGEFAIEPEGYDLICVIHYLQRDLMPAIRGGVMPGGMVVAAIAMVDDAPDITPMNPAFLLQPGELRAMFDGWEIVHASETRKTAHARLTAELIARRPM